MKRLLAVLGLTALLACAPQGAANEEAFAPEIFVEAETTDDLIGTSPALALAPLYFGFPENAEGRQTLTLTVGEAVDGSFPVDLVMRGYLDDSVEGEHYRAQVGQEPETGLWRVESLEKRWRCRRGSDDGWTTHLCP